MNYKKNQRVPVVDENNSPLMPTKLKRAKKWIKDGQAEVFNNDLGLFCVRLKRKIEDPKIQDISLGIDPGKHFTGIGVQSAKCTLLGCHIELPIDENIKQQKKRNNNKGVLKNFVRENRKFEIDIATEILKIYPIKHIIYEVSKTKKELHDCNPTLVGQFWIVDRLKKLRDTTALDGVITSRIRKKLGFVKQNKHKGSARPETQAVDGIALSTHHFSIRKKRKKYILCNITAAPFVFITKTMPNKIKNQKDRKTFFANINKRVDYIGILTKKGDQNEEQLV